MFYKSPQAFYDATYGKSIDVDGAYGAQCWDLFAFFVQKEGIPCSTYCKLTGYAGDLYKLRYDYGYNKYFDFFYPKNAKKGDWIFWDQHVAMVWSVKGNTVTCLGQNQGGIKRVTLKDYTLSTALGCMRYYPWMEYDSNVLYGIDISNWQNQMDLKAVLDRTKTGFVIAKATEGTDFVDKYCDGFLKIAEQEGKKLGVYHFARPEKNGADAEAKFFYEKIRKYVGKAILILDWESSGMSNIKWAKQWLDKVYSYSGIKPMIYMSESVVNRYEWQTVANAGYPLWVAKYRDNEVDYNYDMSKSGTKPSIKFWRTYDMWQWTSSGRLDGYSGNLDCNIFYGDVAAWNRIARGSGMEGWKKEGNNWVYYKAGKKLTGWQFLKWSKGSNWFYFNDKGWMLTGWQKLRWSGGTNWFYFDKTSGAMLTDVHYLEWNGEWDWYVFSEQSGAMLVGEFEIIFEVDASGKIIGGRLA